MMPSHLLRAALLATALIPLAVWSWALPQDEKAWNFSSIESHMGLSARNFIRHGILPLKAAPAIQGGELTLEEARAHRYTHHFPWPGLLVAGGFRLLGHESLTWMRLIAVSFTAIGLWQILVLLRRLGDGTFVCTAFAYLALSPMMLYHGISLQHEPLSFAAVATALRGWVDWRQGRAGPGCFIGGATAACLVCWPPFFFVLSAFLWHLARKDRAAFRALAVLGGATLSVVALFVGYEIWVHGADGFSDILETGHRRMGLGSFASEFTWPGLAVATGRRLVCLFPLGGALLAAIGLSRIARASEELRGVVFMGLSYPLLCSLALPRLVFEPAHEFTAMHFGPGMAVLAGWGASRLRSRGALVALVILMLAGDAWFTSRRYGQREGYALANHLGEYLPALTTPRDRLVTPVIDSCRHAAYQADRYLHGEAALRTPETLEALNREGPGKHWTHVVLIDPETISRSIRNTQLRGKGPEIFACWNIGEPVAPLRGFLRERCPLRAANGIEVYDIRGLGTSPAGDLHGAGAALPTQQKTGREGGASQHGQQEQGEPQR